AGRGARGPLAVRARAAAHPDRRAAAAAAAARPERRRAPHGRAGGAGAISARSIPHAGPAPARGARPRGRPGHRGPAGRRSADPGRDHADRPRGALRLWRVVADPRCDVLHRTPPRRPGCKAHRRWRRRLHPRAPRARPPARDRRLRGPGPRPALRRRVAMKPVRATACSNIALVQYWGKRTGVPAELNLPAVGSLSMTLDALRTETELRPAEADAFELDGRPVHDAQAT